MFYLWRCKTFFKNTQKFSLPHLVAWLLIRWLKTLLWRPVPAVRWPKTPLRWSVPVVRYSVTPLCNWCQRFHDGILCSGNWCRQSNAQWLHSMISANGRQVFGDFIPAIGASGLMARYTSLATSADYSLPRDIFFDQCWQFNHWRII